MKNHIITVLLSLLATALFAQEIRFSGDPVDVYSLNTPEGENYLVLNPHQKGMAFTKKGGLGGISEPEYVSRFYQAFDSSWQAPRVFTDWLNEEGMFSPIGFLSNGEEYFSEVEYRMGAYEGKVMKFLNDGGVVKVDIPFLRNRSPHQSGCLSKDGNYMILSMESNYTIGVEDLYLIKRGFDGKWRSPINLGSQINTEFQEITPFLAADNKTLFFATNGRGGEGSFDIFYSVRLDNSWRKWSEPKNVGSPVNTPGAENSFSFIDGDEWAYFISSQNSDGYGDIRRIKFDTSIEEDTTQAEEVFVKPKLTFKIVDKQTSSALISNMITSNDTLSSINGLFVFEDEEAAEAGLKKGAEIEFKSQGYLPVKMTLASNSPLTHTIELESVSVGSVITLSHVLFHRGTSDMVYGSEEELELVVEVMNDNPTMKILLKGHTDNQGDAVLNLKLSEARAKAVRKYLIRSGINAYRIRSIGYGGNAPVASNDSEETRKLNRRVEFEVVEN